MNIGKIPGKIKNKIKSFDCRAFAGKLKSKYKAWLYGETEQKPRLTSPKAGRYAVSAIVCLVLFAAAFYYMGVYEISFIERPASWENNAARLFSIGEKKDVTDVSAESPDESAAPTSDNKSDSPDSVKSDVPSTNQTKKKKEEKVNKSTVYKTDTELAEEGYYRTDGAYYSAGCEIGKVTLPFELPEKRTYRNMETRTWKITSYDDGTPSTAEDTVGYAERPAVYLYMGYIILDDAGKDLYLCDRYGNILMYYNENYLPAFERNSSGAPLFYSTYGYYADVPAAMETDKADFDTVTELKGAYLTGFNYYSLSASGNYFVSDDFIEERDGRGLCYDYPASFGLPDTSIARMGIMSPKYTTFRDGTSDFVNFFRWNYYSVYDRDTLPDLAEITEAEKKYEALSEKEKLEAIKKKETPEDKYKLTELLPYTKAFNYREGYATVVTNDTGEDPKWETEELRVINTYGEMMFASKKKYLNTDIKDYCSDRYLLPLSKGEDSIGSLYFSNGYMRIRKFSFDQYQLDEWKVLVANSDTDVLVSPNGTEFPIPEGYSLKGYSDGILTLEKNGKYGYMNTAGVWIANPDYTGAAAFHGGIGVLTQADGTVGAVDTEGHLVFPFRYSYISNRSEDLIAAYSENSGWELFAVFTK